MTAIFLVSFAAAAWWLSSVIVFSLSFVAALLYPVRRHSNIEAVLPPLTAIVPVKNVHEGFAEGQGSLLMQNYKSLEVLFAADQPGSPVLSILRDLGGAAPPRFVISDCKAAASPKFNNLWPAICEAKYDTILTKDSNVVLHEGEVVALVERLASGVGLVSAIPVATRLLSFPAWIEASIINCYHARVLMLGDAAGLGFGLGKIMLFRRSDLLRAGGLDAVQWAVGEDMALARAMRRLGLRTVLAHRCCDQILGHRTLRDVWQRQLRWTTIWRVQLPVAFVAALFGSALPTAFAGAVGAHLMGFSSLLIFAATLCGWCGIECLLCMIRGWPISLWLPVAFVVRELLGPALWLRALTTNEVHWAGETCRVRRRNTSHLPTFSESGAPAREAAK